MTVTCTETCDACIPGVCLIADVQTVNAIREANRRDLETNAFAVYAAPVRFYAPPTPSKPPIPKQPKQTENAFDFGDLITQEISK